MLYCCIFRQIVRAENEGHAGETCVVASMTSMWSRTRRGLHSVRRARLPTFFIAHHLPRLLQSTVLYTLIRLLSRSEE